MNNSLKNLSQPLETFLDSQMYSKYKQEAGSSNSLTPTKKRSESSERFAFSIYNN